MFDLPEAKRVRRDEVRSPASSRSPSPVDESDLQDAHARLGKLLNLDGLFEANATFKIAEDTPEHAGGEEDDEQEFEFRLFSAPANPKATAQTSGEEAGETNKKAKHTPGEKQINSGTQKLRIRLQSPTPGSGDPSEGRFVKASRGWQYYFSTPSLWGSSIESGEQDSQLEKREQFQDMAVTGEHIVTWAKSQPWPGCHLPWRLIHLKRHQTKLPRKDKDVPVYVIEGEPPSKSPKSRKKPGKKRRLLLRKRTVAAQVAKDMEAEKRTRKNRERKIKRRQKAREQKAATGTAGDTPMTDADGASSEDD
ncbi:hypothetical protein N7486_008872 [Penicillium sp. IBT 16267x]|nr:hypothetical protein N7486_008872 [Penicillium sp. IBT 16267x]